MSMHNVDIYRVLFQLESRSDSLQAEHNNDWCWLIMFVSAVPDLQFTGSACEGSTLHLSCPNGYILNITYAYFGRADSTTCLDANTILSTNNFTQCRTENILSEIRNVCDNQGECYLISNSTLLQDPCPGTQPYLYVEMRCTSEYVFLSY